MSYEKKMKDLMARLAAMSPEPPPYPEEIQMARPETRKTARPALAFAVAAALVAVLAVPLLLFTGGEEPLLGGSTITSTTVPLTSTTAPVATTTVPEVTTTTVVTPSETSEIVVYVLQEPENSFTEDPALVPLAGTVTFPAGSVPDTPLRNAYLSTGLDELGVTLPDGFSNAIPQGVDVLSVEQQDSVFVVDMTEAFLQGGSGLTADMTILNQLVYTITQGDPTAGVLFTVGGEPIEAYGSDGLVLTDPVTRETFIDQVNVIFLTQPIVESEGTYEVAGMANVFEASLTIQVLDGSGDVVHEEPIQASCGSGCWGTFSTEIDSSLVIPGESFVRLLTFSAEDGSESNVVTVPIPEGGIWRWDTGD